MIPSELKLATVPRNHPNIALPLPRHELPKWCRYLRSISILRKPNHEVASRPEKLSRIAPVVLRKVNMTTKLSSPNTSSINARTR